MADPNETTPEEETQLAPDMIAAPASKMDELTTPTTAKHIKGTSTKPTKATHATAMTKPMRLHKQRTERARKG
jgi:hypothetical protein